MHICRRDAEYYTPNSRVAKNVSGARAYWLDVDCGKGKSANGKGYETVEEAKQALDKFRKDAGLPKQTFIIGSGGGLHVYWALDSVVDRETWQKYAGKLKALTKKLGFLADDTRTADIASVLRVPGTKNQKFTPPRLVEILHASGELISQTVFLAAIDAAYDKFCPVEAAKANTQSLCQSKHNGHSNECGAKPEQYPPDLEKLASALATLMPDCDDPTWKFRRMSPIARAAYQYPEKSDLLYKLLRAWCGGELCGIPSKAWVTPGSSNGLTGYEVFDSVWQRFYNDKVLETFTTIGSVYHDAEETGWVYTRAGVSSACQNDEEDFEQFETTVTPYYKKSTAVAKPAHVVTAADAGAVIPVTTDATDAAGMVDKAIVDSGEVETDTIETVDDKIAAAYKFVKSLMVTVKTDSGAPLEPDAVNALAIIFNHSRADFHRIRTELKKAKGVSITSVESAVRAKLMEGISAQTHHGYASSLITQFAVGNYLPVGHEGSLFVANIAEGIWSQKPIELLSRLVAEAHDGKDYCVRKTDYRNIAEHVITLVTDDNFFSDAPVGLACSGGFYRVSKNDITVEPLTPAHRQRVKVSFTPTKQDIPMFLAFLHDTFQSPTLGEEEQQSTLMQEIAGSILVGIMPKYHKAALLYDPFGRAGKGAIVKIFQVFVPADFVTAETPFNWDREYNLAKLAGSRLNIVGELPEDKPIPAAAFKTVTGGDLLSGRHPTHRPISFKNEAAHVFMSNHLINTRDHSEAFFSRWLISEFPNSRTRLGLPVDPDLSERIMANELPGIAHWALEGAMRLMKNGAFSKSSAQDRLMAQWRRSTNSVEEFIHDACLVGKEYSERRSEFYQDYAKWCSENGRKPFNKSRVKDLLEHNVGLGISHAEIDGYETFKGVMVKPSKVVGFS